MQILQGRKDLDASLEVKLLKRIKTEKDSAQLRDEVPTHEENVGPEDEIVSCSESVKSEQSDSVSTSNVQRLFHFDHIRVSFRSQKDIFFVRSCERQGVHMGSVFGPHKYPNRRNIKYLCENLDEDYYRGFCTIT